MMLEKLWLQIVKVKWPKMVIGSEDYNLTRKAFFVGCMTMMSIIIKVPPHALPKITNKIHDELRAELKRGNAEIINPNLN